MQKEINCLLLSELSFPRTKHPPKMLPSKFQKDLLPSSTFLELLHATEMQWYTTRMPYNRPSHSNMPPNTRVNHCRSHFDIQAATRPTDAILKAACYRPKNTQEPIHERTTKKHSHKYHKRRSFSDLLVGIHSHFLKQSHSCVVTGTCTYESKQTHCW